MFHFCLDVQQNQMERNKFIVCYCYENKHFEIWYRPLKTSNIDKDDVKIECKVEWKTCFELLILERLFLIWGILSSRLEHIPTISKVMTKSHALSRPPYISSHKNVWIKSCLFVWFLCKKLCYSIWPITAENCHKRGWMPCVICCAMNCLSH